MHIVKSCLISLVILLIHNTVGFAATDPVVWGITPITGLAPVEIHGSSAVTYTLTNRLPRAATIVTSFQQTGGDFDIQDGCNNRTLAFGETCDIIITFLPKVVGAASIQLTYGYHNNRIPLPTLAAIGTEHGAGSIVTGAFSDVPTSFTLNNPEQQPIVTVTYTNSGPDPITGYAGNSIGANILTATPSSVATLAILPGSSCGSSSVPIQLSSGGHCQVSGQLTPVGVGAVNLASIFTYANGTKTAEANASSSVVSGSGSCVAVGSVPLPLPANTYQYADNVLQFKFTNTCQSLSTSLGAVTITPTFSPSSGETNTTTIGTDNCSNATLTPHNSCTVTTSVVAMGASNTNMTVTASVPSGGSTAIATTTAPVNANNYQHTVVFINQCPFPVWYGVANDNITNKADPTSPAAPNDYLLAGQVPETAPSTKTLIFPGDYLGLFFPRTGCTVTGCPSTGCTTQNSGQLSCATGQCTPDALPNGGRCALGNEPVAPFTKIEMNFFSAAQSDNSYDGDYDVSLIEGFNVPVEMKAFGPSTTVTPFNPLDPASANNTSFQCGGAGAPIQVANPPTPDAPLASCPWIVTPPSTNTMEPQFFNFVTDGDAAAGQNNCSCTVDNPVCGMAYKASNPQQGNLIMSCGQLIGTWALKQLCTQQYATTVTLTTDNDPRLRFNCDAEINTVSGTQPDYTAGTTLSDIYGCVFNSSYPTILNSCYKDSSVSTSYCCGATDWNTTNPYTTAQDLQSTTQNPDWGGPTVSGTSPIIPSPYETIVWYKNACPTAYAYPFDDHSVSFYCKKSSAGDDVKMNYQVVFCPGGLTGQ